MRKNLFINIQKSKEGNHIISLCNLEDGVNKENGISVSFSSEEIVGLHESIEKYLLENKLYRFPYVGKLPSNDT